MSVKNLAEVDADELRKFLDSFDEVLCDCDGVLFLLNVPIPGSSDAVQFLQTHGKKFRYISNNCTMTLPIFNERLHKMNLNSSKEDIVYPTLAIIWYLKSKNFNKTVYCLGPRSMKTELEEAGINVAHPGPDAIDESFAAIQEHLVDDESIGAVIVDLDVNINFIKLNKALVYLSRPDVLLICGGSDKKIPISNKFCIIGPGYFFEAMSEISRKQAIVLSKPSPTLNDFVLTKFHIKDPSRVLLIGDSLHDIKFASLSNYKKLLVLSGVTKEKDVNSIPEDSKPDYYVESLGTLRNVIKSKLGL